MTDFTHDEENVTAILNGWWNQYFKSPAAFMKTEEELFRELDVY